MPFILEVAEYKFDPVIAQIILQREATMAQLKSECDHRIRSYLESKQAAAEQRKENASHE